MKEYTRKAPAFSLCGLNCALCPRFQTEGPSRCPGCGGPDFAEKHPTCAIVTCSQKHGNVEFCHECEAYPCSRYASPSPKDSFISYRNVLRDQAEAKQNLSAYLETLRKKQALLETLILRYNDGRSKGFYCLAVNLLPLPVLEEILLKAEASLGAEPDSGAAARTIRTAMEAEAKILGVELKLRK